jgi:perosamine synthetase
MIVHSKPWLAAGDRDRIADVLASNMIARGREVERFEAEVGDYLGLPPGVATPSGTRALVCSLKALDAGPGDEIVMPTYVCRSVWEAVRAVGATPRLCDVADDWCVSAETIEPVVTARTRAIIVVHPFGIMADTAPIRRFGVPIIEDCCQAFCRHSDLASAAVVILSFHATKLLTTGEGGMALTADRGLIERIRRIAACEREQLSDLQAALGRSQLTRYPAFLSRRRALADRYFEALHDVDAVLPHRVREHSVFFRFPLRTAASFDQLRADFSQHGVAVRRGVDALLHRSMELDGSLFPGAERAFRETLSIPLYPALTDNEAARVIAAARRVLSRLPVERSV